MVDMGNIAEEIESKIERTFCTRLNWLAVIILYLFLILRIVYG
jgi:hypothetical protein